MSLSSGAGVAARSESRIYAAGRRTGQHISRLLITFFAWADRCLEASVLGKIVAFGVRTTENLWSGSFLMNAFWPYVKLAVAPFGEKLGVETVLGVVLALTCIAPTEVLMIAGAGTFVLILWDRARKARDGQGPLWALPSLGGTVAACSILLFIVGATASSVDPGVSIYNMALWFTYFLFFFMATDAAARGKAEHVAWPFLLGTAFSGLISLYQRMTGWIPPKNWVDVAFEGELVRYVGTFTNPVFFAEMMGLALPLSMALMLSKRDWRDRIALLGFTGLQGLGLLLSSSRGAWLGFAISFCILAVLYDWRMLPLGLCAGAAGLFLAPDIILKRLLSSFSLADSSNAYRVSIWRGSLAMLKDFLFRGVGLGHEAFKKVYPEYQIVQTPTSHAHSTFLQFLIEVGLFGFLAMAVFFVIWLCDGFRKIISTKGPGRSRWSEIGLLAAGIAAVGGHVIEGIIDYTWFSPKITMAFWAVVGISAGMAAGKRNRETSGP